MRRTRLALLTCVPWAAATWLSVVAYQHLSFVGSSIVAAGTFLLATGGAYLLGHWGEMRASAATRRLASSFGLALGTRGAGGIDAVLSRMHAQLEAMQGFKAAFAELAHPALIVTATGEIAAVTRGLATLAPDIRPGENLDALYGEGFLDRAGGAAEVGLVEIGERRFEACRRALGFGHAVIELLPAGHYVDDADLDAFAFALGEGQTGFRFDDAQVARSSVLQAMTAAFETFDLVGDALSRLTAGEGVEPGALEAIPGVGRELRVLAGELGALRRMIRDERARRTALDDERSEWRLAIEGYEAAIANLSEIVEQSHADARAILTGVAISSERIGWARALEEKGIELARDAVHLSQRAERAAEGVGQTAVEIEQAVSLIEDMSLRISLLAPSDSSTGDAGEAHSRLTDQVRALAESSARNAQTIRDIAGRIRPEAEAGGQSAELIGRILGGLELHMQELRDETRTIERTLRNCREPVERLAAASEAAGELAERALLLQERSRPSRPQRQLPRLAAVNQ